jgi:hypothetical protein
LPLNVIATFDLGSNPAPVIISELPIGPEVVLSVMAGAKEDVFVVTVSDDELDSWLALRSTTSVTLNFFDTELDSWLALTIYSTFEDVEGTLKVVPNPPVEFGITVPLVSPWKLIVTGDKGSNPFTCNSYQTSSRARSWVNCNNMVFRR